MLIDARPLFHVLASDRSQYGNITKDTKTELFEQEPTEGTEDNLTAPPHRGACKPLSAVASPSSCLNQCLSYRFAPLKTSSISLLIMLCWLGLSAPSGARIGDTLDQVLKRYGHCLGTVTADNGMTYKVFSRRGLKILVHFYENKVDEITYGKDTDIFDDELKALMQDNAPGEWVGSGWPVNRWHNAAGISAHYSFEHRLLMIVTDAALEREKK
jgi:hypothetical protein